MTIDFECDDSAEEQDDVGQAYQALLLELKALAVTERDFTEYAQGLIAEATIDNLWMDLDTIENGRILAAIIFSRKTGRIFEDGEEEEEITDDIKMSPLTMELALYRIGGKNRAELCNYLHMLRWEELLEKKRNLRRVGLLRTSKQVMTIRKRMKHIKMLSRARVREQLESDTEDLL